MPYQRILVTTDFSEASMSGLVEALRLASDCGASVTLLHVVTTEPPPDVDKATAARIMEQRRHTAREALEMLGPIRDTSVAVEPTVARGKPAREIVLVAQDRQVDLVVMATKGHSAVGRLFLGSTSEAVVRRSKCPVLLVPGEGKAS